MHRENWEGAGCKCISDERERYMNPSTITKRISADQQYSK
jgi:hypothetical protein